MTKCVLVRGIGDVGSAVAHVLHREDYKVVLHDTPLPAWARRKMAFTDAVFDGEALLAGVLATRIDLLSTLEHMSGRTGIAVSVHDFQALLQTLQPDILIDARMRKRQTPERQIHMAQCTIGLGPNFIAQDTTNIVIETACAGTHNQSLWRWWTGGKIPAGRLYRRRQILFTDEEVAQISS